jgi:CRP/FNR family transcriptional regulator, dissimilatory nitrate respiration regulator
VVLDPRSAEIVCRAPIFADLSADAVRELTADAVLRSVDRGRVLFVQAEPATHLFVVLEGWIKVFRQNPDGQEVIIHAFSRGESFAEAAIFEEGVYPASAEAAEDSRLLAIPAASFLRHLRARPELSFAILAALSRRMRFLIQQMERRSTSSAAHRVAEFLLRLCSPGDGPTAVRLPSDKSLIAGRLGMQPETLSRSFARLRRLGVTTRGARVTVGDPRALRRFVEEAG